MAPFTVDNNKPRSDTERFSDVDDPKREAVAGTNDRLPVYDDKETNRILKKVDFRLLPVLALLYLLAFLDRGNIANARIAGMNEELGLSGAQYNMALTVFFFRYAICEVYWGDSIPLYGFTYSAPTIILGLRYTSVQAQLLTVPPYVLGVCSTVLFSWLADLYRTRWPFIYAIASCGSIALLSIPHPRLPGLKYAFLCTIPAGIYPPLIGILRWVGNNLAPSWKRAVGMALLISMGNFGGAIGSSIFLEEQSPNYELGYGSSLGMLVAAISLAMILRVPYGRINKKREALSEEEVRERYSEGGLLNLGDQSPLYRYVV